ncbi:hypothetical protein C8F04DRAFT_710682 [Mycena alexandri]|uniref:Uncharacterized protein n=1 Tax=Mycena alexandri TaxID=1745969 RepID=A0AAD6SR40_9AGAR|nr:hypothetical protein C8F04DRAFT_710682 [Mycena alexandri]
MAGLLASTSPLTSTGVPMRRNDSEESTESAFPSVLNTPADEKPMPFEFIEGKLLSVAAPQVLERPETHKRATTDNGPNGGGRSPCRVLLPRQLSKALEEANISTAEGGLLVRARSHSISVDEPAIPAAPPSPDLMSFSSPELSSEQEEPQRVQTPEPTVIFDAYAESSPLSITRTTPRGCPQLRRDITSPSAGPIPFGLETPGPESTPNARTMLRNRKGMYTLPNDSITGEPAPGVQDASGLHDASHDVAIDADDKGVLSEYDFEHETGGPTLPKLSFLLPLQLVLFPIYCALVGASVLLFPTSLATIAFPASASELRPNMNSNTVARFGFFMRLPYIILAHCLPFTAPPTPIRVFAHWTAVAHLHVAIFLALLVGVAYVVPLAGALVSAGCGALFVTAWGDFSLVGYDGGGLEGKLELGSDVRQMLYQILLTPGCGFADGDRMEKVGEKYLLVRGSPKKPTRAEILAAGGLDEQDSEEDGDVDDE